MATSAPSIAYAIATARPIPKAHPVSSAQALKERLDWGEPALTIIDAGDRETFLKVREMR